MSLFVAFLNLVSLNFGLIYFFRVGRLDVYIYDYLVKKKLHSTAKSFMTEGKVAPDPVGNTMFLNFGICF